MAMKLKPRRKLLEELNEAFSERKIKETAKRLRRLPARAGLGAITEALGIVPKAETKSWRERAGRVPVLIAAALSQGLRAHLRSIDRSARFAGPKAIRVDIRDGANFGLTIVQLSTHIEITLTMRRQPRR